MGGQIFHENREYGSEYLNFVLIRSFHFIKNICHLTNVVERDVDKTIGLIVWFRRLCLLYEVLATPKANCRYKVFGLVDETVQGFQMRVSSRFHF